MSQVDSTGIQTDSSQQTLPWRWRLAGMIRKIPEFRGRDMITGLILRGCLTPRGTFSGSFGPDLRFKARYDEDGSLQDLFFCQHEEPALVGILEAVLEPGNVFFDVGANIGIYSGWAARIVGPEGRVHAFEPVPSTRNHLEDFLEMNRIENVSIVPYAVGKAAGSIQLYCRPGASGLASAVETDAPDIQEMEVPTINLDEYVNAARDRKPQLLKIDVEGYEFEVLRGARELLSSIHPPAVIFEAEATQLARAGVQFVEIANWLQHEVGFQIYSLTPRGLVDIGDSAHALSLNVLALHPSTHGSKLARLRHKSFRRNQSC